MPTPEETKQIKEGQEEHGEITGMSPEERVYAQMSEQELLSELEKERAFVRDQRKIYREHFKDLALTDVSLTHGVSFIGDDNLTLARIEMLKKTLDEKGVQYVAEDNFGEIQ